MVRRSKMIGPNGETYNPTLKAPKDIDVEKDCIALRNAMKGLGTDESGLIEILGHRSLDQRLAIREAYKTSFGEDLISKLDGELSGNFKHLVHMLMMDWAMVNARALYNAIKGAGTKESVIVEILCTATNAEIDELKEAYQAVLAEEGESDPSRTLEADLENDLSGYFKRLTIALIQGNREELDDEQLTQLMHQGLKSVVQMDAVEQDFADIYDAGAGQLGTDEATFIRILATRNVWHLKTLAKLYEQQTGKTLMDAIDSETSGDFGDALKLTLFTCLSRTQSYSELLKHSMEGLGTTDSTLMRIIVTRCEIDLADISRQFESDQGKSLEQWVQEDTSGDYEKLLLVLLGGN